MQRFTIFGVHDAILMSEPGPNTPFAHLVYGVLVGVVQDKSLARLYGEALIVKPERLVPLADNGVAELMG